MGKMTIDERVQKLFEQSSIARTIRDTHKDHKGRLSDDLYMGSLTNEENLTLVLESARLFGPGYLFMQGGYDKYSSSLQTKAFLDLPEYSSKSFKVDYCTNEHIALGYSADGSLRSLSQLRKDYPNYLFNEIYFKRKTDSQLLGMEFDFYLLLEVKHDKRN